MTEEEKGYTASERYLGKLCRATFLSLWSHQNPFTDRGVTEKNKTGKELCDLLVIFENNVIIFSDKSCEVPNTGDINRDWSRWYRKAIAKSADQIFGAERWLKTFPRRVFLDRQCQTLFPVPIPNQNAMKVHRIVVALGAGKRTADYFGNGSRGSLMLTPSIRGEAHFSPDLPSGPFRIGQVAPDQGFVHVFDDVTLDIVMKELDTIRDFVAYLQAKEDFFTSGQLAICAGEEELLAFYLANALDGDSPGFVIPKEYSSNKFDGFGIDEGLWDEYLKVSREHPWHSLKLAGAFVDALIERFSDHIASGTLAYGPKNDFSSHERNVRFLAAEPRDQRAKMAHAISQKVASTPSNIRTSIVLPSANPNTMFFFLLFPRSTGQPHHNYRLERQAALTAYAHVIKLKYPDVRFVYGLATEPGQSLKRRSEDLMSFDFENWSEADNDRARQIQREGQILETYTERRLFTDPPNTERADLDQGNRQERRKARALRRKK